MTAVTVSVRADNNGGRHLAVSDFEDYETAHASVAALLDPRVDFAGSVTIEVRAGQSGSPPAEKPPGRVWRAGVAFASAVALSVSVAGFVWLIVILTALYPM